MKVTSNQVVLHDEYLSKSQMVALLQEFMFRFSDAWIKEQKLSEEDFSYIVTQIKKGENE